MSNTVRKESVAEYKKAKELRDFLLRKSMKIYGLASQSTKERHRLEAIEKRRMIKEAAKIRGNLYIVPDVNCPDYVPTPKNELKKIFELRRLSKGIKKREMTKRNVDYQDYVSQNGLKCSNKQLKSTSRLKTDTGLKCSNKQLKSTSRLKTDTGLKCSKKQLKSTSRLKMDTAVPTTSGLIKKFMKVTARETGKDIWIII